MIRIYSHLFLKDMNLFEIQERFEEKGTTLEINSAGEYLVGRETESNNDSVH